MPKAAACIGMHTQHEETPCSPNQRQNQDNNEAISLCVGFQCCCTEAVPLLQYKESTGASLMVLKLLPFHYLVLVGIIHFSNVFQLLLSITLAK